MVENNINKENKAAGAQPRLTFPKSERLRHRTLVEGVFSKGESLYEYPLRLCWRTLSDEELKSCFRNSVPSGIAPLQMMVTIPKKKRRRAVDRVLMRRRVRDAYRLRRRPLRAIVEDADGLRTLSLAIVYIGTENADSAKIRRKIDRLLSRLEERVAAVGKNNADAMNRVPTDCNNNGEGNAEG